MHGLPTPRPCVGCLAVQEAQASAAPPAGELNPELAMLEAFKQAMQLNPLSADVLLRQIRAEIGGAGWARAGAQRLLPRPRSAKPRASPPVPGAAPDQHRVLDFWLLLVMLALGPERRKAAEGTLR